MQYALVDTAARADAADALRFHAGGHEARSLFIRQPESQHANAGPWLVALDGNPGMTGWLLALDMHPGAVAWLTSDVNFDALFNHLESCLDLRLANGQLALLRFWDGRVFWRINSVLRPEQKGALMGPVTRWSVRLNGKQWVVDARTLEKAP